MVRGNGGRRSRMRSEAEAINGGDVLGHPGRGPSQPGGSVLPPADARRDRPCPVCGGGSITGHYAHHLSARDARRTCVMLYPVALAEVRWRTPAEGGRSLPPSGPVYSTVAQLTDYPEYFSVVLRFVGAKAPSRTASQQCELTLLAPDRLPDVVAKLVPGAHLLLREGRRIVAECTVVAVRGDENGAGSSSPPARFTFES
jgi:hypothetical protein